MSLIGIIRSGDVVGVIKKVWSLIFGHDMPDELAALVAKFSTEEGQVFWQAGKAVVGDIASGKSFEEAVNDGWEVIKAQAGVLTKADLADAAGIQSRAAQNS